MSTGGKMRLNRYIARSGAGSRRETEKFILAGRVMINGNVCTELATTVDPGVDEVTLDGKPLVLPSMHYYKYYKPRGVVSSMDDPHAERTIADALREHGIEEGVVPAGRLDKDSEGLLILSNDGDLLNRLTHPSFEVDKVYRVLIDRWPIERDLNEIREGIECAEFTAKALGVRRMGPQPPDEENPVAGYWLEIIMGEGKKREIREMLDAVGYRVLRLVRISHGPINGGDLEPGQISELSEMEIESLPNSHDG